MNLRLYFPELSEGQLRMLENYIQEREEQAIRQAKELPQNL